MKKLRVLIVDDSATMRQLICLRLRRDPRLEVVGEAANAAKASEAIARLRPDVMTLDVEMPGKSGLEFLREQMKKRPLPVIMISSETQKGSAAAVEALSCGAFECLGKPRAGFSGAFEGLPSLIVAAASANLQPATFAAATPKPVLPREHVWNRKIVLIGSSTGGVDALEKIISGMPKLCPPIIVTQHMPAGFINSFVHRLNGRYAPEIVLAHEGAEVVQGRIYFAPGGTHHVAIAPGLVTRCTLIASDKVNGHRPSVDMLFDSAQKIALRVVATILTGMGNDGAKGMLRLRNLGAICLAQDEESSVVWGMPRIAWQNGGAQRLVPLSDMAAQLLAATERQSQPRLVKG